VFSRKAATIRKSTALSSWLHAVALRVTANLKRERARRGRRERIVRLRSSSNPADEVSWAEVQAALDEELQRLPERYRAVLILCYLEGKTRDEAADHLGLSAGALHGLLERGRKLLAERLTKRGVTLSAGLFGVALGNGVLQASLTPTQLLSTAHASSLFALGKPVGEPVSAAVLNLSQQVLKGMLMTKLKLVSAGVLGAALLITSVGFTFAQPAGAEKERATYLQALNTYQVALVGKKDTDAAFIKRVSMDLRGIEPSPAEIHFFVNSKDPKRRETLVDLFIKERETKQQAARVSSDGFLRDLALQLKVQAQMAELQNKKKDEEARQRDKQALVDAANKAAQEEARIRDKRALADAARKLAQLDLLRANVDVARAAVKQKEALLKAASDAKAKELDLLTTDLLHARAVLQQAIAALKAAETSPTKQGN